MKNRACHIALGFLATLAVVPAAPSPLATPPAIPIGRQIDALLKSRLRPEPLPLDLPNPFVLPGASRHDPVVSAAANANPNEIARPPTSGEVLADVALHLRVGGLMKTKDQVQLVINDLPRREGDVMTVPWNGTRIQITLVLILNDQMVLRYNDAKLAVRF